MAHDSTKETRDHIGKVQDFIGEVVLALIERAHKHDASKLASPEKEVFDQWTPRLSSVAYGTDDYHAMLDKMRPAIDHHQKHNRHHPEYFGEDGVHGMDLVDLVEMLCDWKAATLRSPGGDIAKSIEVGMKRHNMPPYLVRVLINTVANLDW